MNTDNKDTFSSMDEIPVMMTVEEMGKLLRISRTTAYQYVRDGKIPYILIGKQIRIYRGDVFAARNRRGERKTPR